MIKIDNLKETVCNSYNLLECAINDENREKYGLAVVFNTREKHPGFNNWQTYAKEDQSDEDVRRLYNKAGTKATSYSYFTGIGGLVDLDFDWELTYHILKRRYPEMFDTLTIKTPNGGYRCLYVVEDPKDYLKFKQRSPRVEIHGKEGKHVIVHGKGNDDNGYLQEYIVVNDLEIKRANDIIKVTSNFLEEWSNTCSFLEYQCIKNAVSHKKNHCTHEQRTSIAAFFHANGIDIEDAIDFFRTFTDFDYNITKDHLERIYEKDFKHPTCSHLKTVFNINDDTCKNCIRKKEYADSDQIVSTTKEFDLSQIDASDIFSLDDDNLHDDIKETPITTIDGSIYYLIP
ncbi:MAG: bifunctional DNA primase/polymerase, partial [Clostridiaceae bacterium]